MARSDQSVLIGKALWLALPAWVRRYTWVVGIPSWLTWAWLVLSGTMLDRPVTSKVAFIAFASVAALQAPFIFRAFWRNEI